MSEHNDTSVESQAQTNGAQEHILLMPAPKTKEKRTIAPVYASKEEAEANKPKDEAQQLHTVYDQHGEPKGYTYSTKGDANLALVRVVKQIGWRVERTNKPSSQPTAAEMQAYIESLSKEERAALISQALAQRQAQEETPAGQPVGEEQPKEQPAPTKEVKEPKKGKHKAHS